MVITCPACEARYRLGRDKIQGRGAKITCPKCSHVFVVFNESDDDGAASAPAAPRRKPPASFDKETTTGAFKAVLGRDDEKVVTTTTGKIRVVAPGKRGARRSVTTSGSGGVFEPPADITAPSPSLRETPAAPAPEPALPELDGDLRASDLNFREVGIKTWKVKVAIGLIYDFSDIATLKKYLGDKKVTPDDLISHNNKDWTRIGDIPDLDQHFVEVWKQAKHLIATGERPAVQPKKKAPKADDTGSLAIDSSLSGTMAAATREVAGATGSHRATTTSTIPAAYGGRSRSRREQRRKEREKESSGAPVALLILAAVIVVGGLIAWRAQPDRSPVVDGPAPVAAAEVGKVSERELSEIEKQIQADLERKQAEVAAEVSDDVQEAADMATAREKTLAEKLRDGEIERVRNPTTSSRPVPVKPQPKYRAPVPQSDSSGGSQASVSKQTHSDPAKAYLKVAQAKLQSKDFGAARKAAETATKKSPGCVPCWNALGEAYQQLGQPQDAAAAFAKAEQLAGGGSSSQAGQ